MMMSGRRRVILVVLPFLVCLSQISMAQAASLTVNTTTDTVDATIGNGTCADATGQCSLRAAIQEANSLAGNDQITVPAGTYTLTIAPTSNEHSAAKGDLDINQSGASLTITGAGAGQTIIDANSVDRVFDIRSGSTAVLEGLTIKNGKVTESASVLQGAGIRVGSSTGALTLTGCSLESNGTGQAGLDGGALYNLGTATLADSTVSSNTAEDGAALYQDGTALIVVNSTVSGNTATANGGGLYYISGTVSLNNATLYGNQAATGGGVNTGTTTDVKLRNTVIAGNDATVGKDCAGQLTSEGNNWIQVQTGCNVTGVSSGDPLMTSTLADNGGTTKTHALLSSSPLLDAGDPDGCDYVNASSQTVSLTTDQRGTTRPLKALAASSQALCDIGAFELNPCGNVTSESTLGEECDDGNLTSGDGCSATCLDEDKDDDGTLGSNGQTADCNDNNAAVKPGATETCNDTDDDCDGSTDEGFSDKGSTCTVGTGACAGTGTMACHADGTRTVCSTSASNPGTESCNGIDDDCDGSTDEDLGQTSCGAGLCAVTVANCENGQSQTCAADDSKSTTEVCGNEIDEDCDGQDASCPDSTESTENTGDSDTGEETGGETAGDTDASSGETSASSDSGGGCSLIP